MLHPQTGMSSLLRIQSGRVQSESQDLMTLQFNGKQERMWVAA